MGGFKIDESTHTNLNEVLAFANEMFQGGAFAAGTKHVTIADLSLLASLSTMATIEHVDLSPFPEIRGWFEKMKKEVGKKYDELDGKGAEMYGQIFNPMVKANK
jgi:glutathione S-transferase